MRSRTANWFETKIRYEKMMDDGKQKMVTELYVVDALSFTEAEASIIEEMSSYISGEFKVTGISQSSYGEIFFSDIDTDDRFFKVKLQFITIDEKTEKEKRSNVIYLVQAHTLQQAVKNIEEVMSSTMIDYAIVAVQETQIMDVFEHNAAKKTEIDAKPEYEE
ncbi:MAG: DUF4494 domain-containing protein [Prevotella sp.]|nr:DUF4494 domain-containing protein [Prevotella sp.]